jgi:hypothetical protein
LILVPDVSSTVTSIPVHVSMVKLDAAVLSMVPVAPPSAGADRGAPPVPMEADVVEAEEEDGEMVAADATPVPASRATADVTPAPTIQALLIFSEDRRARGRLPSTGTHPRLDPSAASLVGS